ncbi:MAG: hypothetical protein C4576_32555 [Desulfobacteraceae bacterium]|jgi:formylmethanofuran dehydrogenase subunit B|nr:MAG: hypothetical protein C4576_32555 [Desulfobacteraceae bacterium]
MIQNAICTGCGCLCDDIGIETAEGGTFKVFNACIKGYATMQGANYKKRRPLSCVKGKETDPQSAINHALDKLLRAKNVMIFGLDNSTLEAQGAALCLSRKINAGIDDYSSSCWGPLIEMIIKGRILSCSMEMAKESDMLVYWGANPFHSHPRHISYYTYYAQEKYNTSGWLPRICLTSVDVRETELTRISDEVVMLRVGEDRNIITEVLHILSGGKGSASSQRLTELFKKSNKTIIFAGSGLMRSLGAEFGLYVEMVNALNRNTRVYTIPMLKHFNMMGFNRTLFAAQGVINQIAFKNGNGISPERYSFTERIACSDCDCVIAVGSNPVQDLPYALAKKLLSAPLIAIDSFRTLTTDAADISIPAALPGVETGGSAVRMDGREMPLHPLKDVNEYASDDKILTYLAQNM